MKAPITTAQAMSHPDVVLTINTLGKMADELRKENQTLLAEKDNLESTLDRVALFEQSFLYQKGKIERLQTELATLKAQEPVAWFNAKRDMTYMSNFNKDDIPLFLAAGAQEQRKKPKTHQYKCGDCGLTGEQQNTCWCQAAKFKEQP